MKLKKVEIKEDWGSPSQNKVGMTLWAAYHQIEQILFNTSIENNEYGLNPDDAGDFQQQLTLTTDHLYNAINIIEDAVRTPK